MKQRHHRKRVQRRMHGRSSWNNPRFLRRVWVSQSWFKDAYCSLPSPRPSTDYSDHSADAFAYFVQAMQSLKTDLLPSDLDVSMAVDNRTAKEVESYRAEAEKRLRNLMIFGNTHPEFYLEEWQPRERTKLELAAMEIAQQAELFDRTLPHYVREGSFEAIPADAGTRRLSGCNFQALITAAAERLCVDRGEVVRAEREYSRSSEFVRWLQDNPPGRRE